MASKLAGARLNRRLAISAGFVLALGSAVVFAADGSGAPNENGAAGIRLGKGRLHPYANFNTIVVNNPGALPLGGPTDMSLALRPGVDYEIPSDKLNLKLRLAGEYRQYLGLQQPGTRGLSTFSGEFGGDVILNKKSKFVSKISETLKRTAEPATQTVGGRLLHTSSETKIDFKFKPGGGALIFDLGHTFFYDRYDRGQVSLGNNAAAQDNMQNQPRFKVTWKFFPKTAAFFEARGNLTYYPTKVNSGLGANVDTQLLELTTGLIGSITKKISTNIGLGYGDSLLGGADNFRSIVGSLAMTYKISERNKLKLNISRSVMPSSGFKYVESNRLGLDYSQKFARRFEAEGKLAYTYMRFGLTTAGLEGGAAFGATNFPGRRVESAIDIKASLDYRMTKWLSLGLGASVSYRRSNWPTQVVDGTATVVTTSGYLKTEFLLRTTIRY